MQFVEFLPYIAMLLSAIIGFLNLVYTRKTGKSIDKELNNMFIKTPTFDKVKSTSPQQVFSPLVKTYRRDGVTGELVENPDLLDVDKLVESCRQSCLDKLLERFLPHDVVNELNQEVDATESDLSTVGSALEALDEWREKFGLDASVSNEEVFKRMQAYRDEAVAKASAAEKSKLEADASAAEAQRIAQLKAELASLENKENKKDET